MKYLIAGAGVIVENVEARATDEMEEDMKRSDRWQSTLGELIVALIDEVGRQVGDEKTTYAVVGPAAVLAGELNATVVKSDKAKNQVVIHTGKGEETLELKGVKGSEHAKAGARVTVKVNDKDGKVNEITPGE
jgi:hypothetical protein